MKNVDKDKFIKAENFLKKGGFNEAYKVLYPLYSRYKNDSQFLYKLAVAAIYTERTSQAKKIVAQFIKLNPSNAEGHHMMGILALKEKTYEAAIQAFQQCIKLAPTYLDAYSNLALAYSEINQDEETERFQFQACQMAPNRIDLMTNHAQTLKNLGKFEQVETICQKALSLAPAYAEAWRILATINKLNSARDLKGLEDALDKNENAVEKAKIHFAIARMHEDENSLDKAFKHFDIGNALMDQAYNFDISVSQKYFEAIKEKYQESLMNKFDGCGFDTDKLIFIVGMPRSGTTLIEQILFGHSEVDAGGELTFLDYYLNQQGTNINRPYPFSLDCWRRKDLKEVGKKYLNSIEMLKPKAKFFTDKMPENFMHIGMIHSIFPNARIIHCTRNPIDTCLGNYRQLFQLNSLRYTYSQEKLIHYYRAYQSLMKHWKKLLGDEILDVKYEDLVQDSKSQTERILSHCGLSWEEQCLILSKNERAVKTVSSVQVREGIHKKNLDKWRKYEKFLQPLVDEFNNQ